jgi:hypothetical protein
VRLFLHPLYFCNILSMYGLNQGALKKGDADGSDEDEEEEDEEGEMDDAPTPRSVDRESVDAAGAEAKLEDERLQAIAASARAFAPTGHTLKTTEVKTKIPEILRATLREYQPPPLTSTPLFCCKSDHFSGTNTLRSIGSCLSATRGSTAFLQMKWAWARLS